MSRTPTPWCSRDNDGAPVEIKKEIAGVVCVEGAPERSVERECVNEKNILLMETRVAFISVLEIIPACPNQQTQDGPWLHPGCTLS